MLSEERAAVVSVDESFIHIYYDVFVCVAFVVVVVVSIYFMRGCTLGC